MAQVKTARAQVWKRNGHLVRSVLAIVYGAIGGNLTSLISAVIQLASSAIGFGSGRPE
jgi:hypothetical protein